MKHKESEVKHLQYPNQSENGKHSPLILELLISNVIAEVEPTQYALGSQPWPRSADSTIYGCVWGIPLNS